MALVDDLSLRCLGEPERPITEEFCEKIGVPYADVFTRAEAMAKAAQAMRIVTGDVFSKLPFCVTVEAETLGAEISLNALYGVPTVVNFLYGEVSEIGALPSLNLTRGRIFEVLRAARLLSDAGERVILNIEGPFTIIGLLVPSKSLYKGLYRERKKLVKLCRALANEIARYARAAEEAGVSVLSYADPTVAYELISPKMYEEFCGEVSYEALRSILRATESVTVHLCNKTSVGFEKAGFCTSERVEISPGLSYGEALSSVLGHPDCRLIGHGCIQRSSCPCSRGYLYKLKLREQSAAIEEK